MHTRTYAYYVRMHMIIHIIIHNTHIHSTGCRRLIGSPKFQIIFHKRATKYRSLLRKMTRKDKGSYESSPPCMNSLRWIWWIRVRMHMIIHIIIHIMRTHSMVSMRMIWWIHVCMHIVWHIIIHNTRIHDITSLRIIRWIRVCMHIIINIIIHIGYLWE